MPKNTKALCENCGKTYDEHQHYFNFKSGYGEVSPCTMPPQTYWKYAVPLEGD